MNLNLRNITNHYGDARLISLASWRQAGEFTPRDRGGPYVVMQEGFDPEDLRMVPDEFVLGRSGKWLSLGHFYHLPVPDRRAEYIFGTVGEIMQLMSGLPTQVELLRPAGKDKPAAPPAGDEMVAALEAGRTKNPSGPQ